MKTFLKVAGIVALFLIPAVLFITHMVLQVSTANVELQEAAVAPTPTPIESSLSLSHMKQAAYPGSRLRIEQVLPDGPQYRRSLISYMSDGLKVEGLLTIPIGPKPKNGWPAILLNHGYVSPEIYIAATNYANIVNAFASQGYVVLMPDYRGNGLSQGVPIQPYIAPDYTADSLNALASLKRYNNSTASSEAVINVHKIGVFGHSMGGNVTLHDLIISHVFKAGVIWAGSVGSYTQIIPWWGERYANGIPAGNDLDTYYALKQMIKRHGIPQTNPGFWYAIDPTNFLEDVTSPTLLQVGTADHVVPEDFTLNLYKKLQNKKKKVSLITYPGADHNLAPDTYQALKQSISFFNTYLK